MFDTGGLITNLFMCFKSSGIKPPLDIVLILSHIYKKTKAKYMLRK